MVTREECESLDMDFIYGFKRSDNSYDKGFCRKRRIKEVRPEEIEIKNIPGPSDPISLE